MILVILAVLGLCFGSFVNALVWRLKKQSELVIKKLPKATSPSSPVTRYSVLKGRSMCPDCQHSLSVLDLVPVLSWISLKGKCRYCKKPISWQYPFVEILAAILFVLSYIFWPDSPLTTSYSLLTFITWLIVLVGLIALAVYDIKWMILPDKIVYPLLIITAGSLIIQLAIGRSVHGIVSAAFAAAIGGGIFWIIYQVSQGKWIGGGDVKLGFLLGLILAKPELALLLLFLSSVIAMIFIGPLLALKKLKKDSKIPFGPFLIAACILIVLYGNTIIDWYKTAMLLG